MNLDDQARLATLNDILGETELVIGEDGALYATFSRDDHKVTYPTSSPDFMTWFRGQAVERLSSVPGAKLIKQAIEEAEHRVQMNNLPCPIASRFFADEMSAVIHLGHGKDLEIDAKGAVTVRESGVLFPTRMSMESLPDPKAGNILEVLPELLDLPEYECRLALSWLISLLQPHGRYPVLIICGPRQSGKTRLASNLRQLLDPHPVPLLPLPEDHRGLKAAVADNAILAFDNVQKVALEAELLALAAGTALVPAGWSRPVQCKRPIILVCKDLPDAPDLIENAIILRLKERPAKAFKGKSELDRMYRDLHGKALGSLANACTLALQHRKTVELDAVQKDAELEKWIVALDKGLGLGGEMLAALQHNLEQTLAGIIRERPAVGAFYALVRAKGSIKATATQLLDEIEPFLEGSKDPRYPTSGKAMAHLLRHYRRFMIDIDIEFDVRTGKDRDRNIVATWQGPKAARGEAAAASPTKARGGRNKATGLGQDQPTLL
jgi:hypothetical protein